MKINKKKAAISVLGLSTLMAYYTFSEQEIEENQTIEVEEITKMRKHTKFTPTLQHIIEEPVQKEPSIEVDQTHLEGKSGPLVYLEAFSDCITGNSPYQCDQSLAGFTCNNTETLGAPVTFRTQVDASGRDLTFYMQYGENNKRYDIDLLALKSANETLTKLCRQTRKLMSDLDSELLCDPSSSDEDCQDTIDKASHFNDKSIQLREKTDRLMEAAKAADYEPVRIDPTTIKIGDQSIFILSFGSYKMIFGDDHYNAEYTRDLSELGFEGLEMVE